MKLIREFLIIKYKETKMFITSTVQGIFVFLLFMFLCLTVSVVVWEKSMLVGIIFALPFCIWFTFCVVYIFIVAPIEWIKDGIKKAKENVS